MKGEKALPGAETGACGAGNRGVRESDPEEGDGPRVRPAASRSLSQCADVRW